MEKALDFGRFNSWFIGIVRLGSSKDFVVCERSMFAQKQCRNSVNIPDLPSGDHVGYSSAAGEA